MPEMLLSVLLPRLIWGFVSTSAFREWCVFGAEILVAWVIYLEVRHSRSVSFLEKATNNKSNRDRREIYDAFAKLPGTLEEKANEFCNMILSPENEDLRKRSERQIALFNDLGFSCRKPLWSRLGWPEDPLVSLLPHATIYIWVILSPYMMKRRRETGPWYSAPLMKFTTRSVDFVLRHKRGLRFINEQGGLAFEITTDALKQLRRELARVSRQA